jgi:hypothetical protein
MILDDTSTICCRTEHYLLNNNFMAKEENKIREFRLRNLKNNRSVSIIRSFDERPDLVVDDVAVRR